MEVSALEEKIRLICPICAGRLFRNEKSYVCEKRHSFDIARQGYINLLPVQNKHSLSPGDTKAMLVSRREFLDKGYYEPVCLDIAGLINRFAPFPGRVTADIGCGEGYYTSRLRRLCGGEYIGIDIAKEAARMCCQRSRDILWAVATAAHLPLEDGSADVITAVFSLYADKEYARVLKKGGIVIEVSAGSEHLIELKRIIYDQVFEQNKQQAPFSENFRLLYDDDRSFRLCLPGDEVKTLLAMTPHAHRIGREQSERLDSIDKMDMTINYKIRALERL